MKNKDREIFLKNDLYANNDFLGKSAVISFVYKRFLNR